MSRYLPRTVAGIVVVREWGDGDLYWRGITEYRVGENGMGRVARYVINRAKPKVPRPENTKGGRKKKRNSEQLQNGNLPNRREKDNHGKHVSRLQMPPLVLPLPLLRCCTGTLPLHIAEAAPGQRQL